MLIRQLKLNIQKHNLDPTTQIRLKKILKTLKGFLDDEIH